MGRKGFYFAYTILLLALTTVVNANNSSDTDSIFNPWKAGTIVIEDSVRQYGIDKCFVAEEISDHVFARMQGKSYGKGCTVARSQLRYLRVLHCDGNGNTVLGEIVCNRSIANDLVEIFRKLYDARYPIERMVLIDEYDGNDDLSMSANNTSCFNFRMKTSAAAGLSKHAYGLAIDINPLYNPYYKKKADGTIVVEPVGGKPYLDRQKKFKYKIIKDDLCYKLFIEHGFKWGGNWRSVKDYQHFEK